MTELPRSDGAFDEHNPPRFDLIDDCVHCGFCLSACPTYSVLGQEMDSPRGRIDLMRQGLEGEPLSRSMVAHFDQCLGCMACVPACPSGVRYDKLIEATRVQVERRHRRPFRERLLRGAIFATFPYARRLALLHWPLWLYQNSGLCGLVRRSPLYRRLPATLRALDAITPTITSKAQVPVFVAAKGTRRAVVGMLTGCVQSAYFSGVNAATARVLSAEGCDVVIPKGQSCCGALSAHSGREDEAKRFARKLIDQFEQAHVECVVVNSAGCGSAMKNYGDLLRDDPVYAERAERFSARTRDVAEYLHELGPVATRHPLRVTMAYHDACHLSNAQGIRSQPRELLAQIPGVVIREIADGHVCCGSAGIYNLVQPDMARELAQRKAANIRATGAELVVAANPGCLLQIAAALNRGAPGIRLVHTIEVLDASIEGTGIGSSPR